VRDYERELIWVASAYKDLIALSDDLRERIGQALELARRGQQAAYAKRMKGRLRDVIEIRVDDLGKRTFRVTYSVAFINYVYVLDVFQKKSKHGIETAHIDLDRIAGRLRQAKAHHEKHRDR
jgi:phage-related protein